MKNRASKTQLPRKSKETVTIKTQVTIGFGQGKLEPELEEMAALWTPTVRLQMAAKFEAWARQLKGDAAAVVSEDQPHPTRWRN
jgi:hypothetical protein